jgi:hypothetical protein
MGTIHSTPVSNFRIYVSSSGNNRILKTTDAEGRPSVERVIFNNVQTLINFITKILSDEDRQFILSRPILLRVFIERIIDKKDKVFVCMAFMVNSFRALRILNAGFSSFYMSLIFLF